MPMQMTVDEQELVDKMLRQGKGDAMDALRTINAKRRRGGVAELGKTAVYRYVNGVTHRRQVSEKRGRKRTGGEGRCEVGPCAEAFVESSRWGPSGDLRGCT